MPEPDLSLVRCCLIVPGHRPDRFDKAVERCGDAVLIDLEDGVPQAAKAEARTAAAGWLAAYAGRVPVGLRINGLGDRAALDDLAALADGSFAAAFLALPKVEAARDVALVRRWTGGRPAPILAMIETVAGLRDADAIAAAVAPSGGLAFGGVDYAASIGAEVAWEPLLAARSHLAAAAGAAGVPVLDVPWLALDDDGGLRAEASRVRALGFSGKTAIHPAQVGPILEAFTPPASAVAEALEIRDAFEAAGGGAVRAAGRMVDQPVYDAALRTLARARPAE